MSREANGALIGAHILFVDDSPENLLLVRRNLEAEGYTVDFASTAEVALEQLSQNKYDLVLSDINLPEIDGYTLVARIKSAPGLERMKVVAVTSFVMKGDKEKVLAAGFDGYIRKPIDVDQFPREVQRFLEG